MSYWNDRMAAEHSSRPLCGATSPGGPREDQCCTHQACRAEQFGHHIGHRLTKPMPPGGLHELVGTCASSAAENGVIGTSINRYQGA
jgi:hypothetical protein